MVWGIAADDEYDDLVDYRDALGLTFPILFDEDGAVHALYQQQTAYDQTIYPQDWLIDSDGRVAYLSNSYEPATIEALVRAELGLR